MEKRGARKIHTVVQPQKWYGARDKPCRSPFPVQLAPVFRNIAIIANTRILIGSKSNTYEGHGFLILSL